MEPLLICWGAAPIIHGVLARWGESYHCAQSGEYCKPKQNSEIAANRQPTIALLKNMILTHKNHLVRSME